MDNDELATQLRELADEIEQDEAGDSLSKDEAVQQFIDEHPSLLEDTLRDDPAGEGYGYIGYTVDGRPPGKSDIGGDRTDAESALEEAGYRFDIKSIEELPSMRDGDLSVHFDIIELDDE